MRQKIAVIGGGAKAVAIASKAKVLADVGLLDCEVHVFEERDIGSSWSGKHGYTDGLQALCTPAEKDLGFPYLAWPGGPDVAEKMMATFSWGVFKASGNYADWVDLGRRPASHLEFASYLNWGFGQTDAELHRRKVVGLAKKRFPGRPARNGWVVASADPRSGAIEVSDDVFDGVVVTGHGPARNLNAPVHDRLLDGKNFWDATNRSKVLKIAKAGGVTQDNPLVVIGGGGTAAAILAWLPRQGLEDIPVVMLADQATFYTRGDSVFENRMFSDNTFWRLLSHKTRRSFFERLTRGVVWEAEMDDLVKLTALRFIDGRVGSITVGTSPNLNVNWHRKLSPAEIKVGLEAVGVIEAGQVINATGFDSWWFLDLLPSGVIPVVGKTRDRLLERLTVGMDEDLAFDKAWTLPPLHAPFQSLMIGPGFASLLALGDMADRVLRRYVDRSRLTLS